MLTLIFKEIFIQVSSSISFQRFRGTGVRYTIYHTPGIQSKLCLHNIQIKLLSILSTDKIVVYTHIPNNLQINRVGLLQIPDDQIQPTALFLIITYCNIQSKFKNSQKLKKIVSSLYYSQSNYHSNTSRYVVGTFPFWGPLSAINQSGSRPGVL